MASTTLAREEAQLFRYEKPERDGPKVQVDLCATEILRSGVQVVGEDGANNLHSHHDNDGMWFVLEGEARFYTAGEEVVGEFGKHEGLVIPRGFPYWFESIGEQDLEILHVVSEDQEVDGPHRVDHEGSKGGRSTHFDGQTGTVEDPRKR